MVGCNSFIPFIYFIIQCAFPGKFIRVGPGKSCRFFRAVELDVSLSFLPPGNFTATIYSDAKNCGDPNHLVLKTIDVKNTDTIPTMLNAGGGMVMHIRRK